MIEQRPPAITNVDTHLQPYPDRFLEELKSPEHTPEQRAVLRERVGLAYVAAMQLLPAKQRAVLALRDGLARPRTPAADQAHPHRRQRRAGPGQLRRRTQHRHPRRLRRHGLRDPRRPAGIAGFPHDLEVFANSGSLLQKRSVARVNADIVRIRLAELVAALSLGIDLGFGQPMEHVLRQCLIALRLAERIGLDEQTSARSSTTPRSSSTSAATPTRTSRRSGSATTSRSSRGSTTTSSEHRGVASGAAAASARATRRCTASASGSSSRSPATARSTA